jgi:hypothetical protein
MSAGSMPKHRFFRAMVVMGGSLAAGCGGVSRSESTGPATPGELGDDGGVDLEGSTSSPELDAGHDASGPNDRTSIDATLVVPPLLEVEAGPLSTFEAGALGCPEAQWACPMRRDACPGAPYQLVLPLDCACDRARPLSASDCQAGETFVCQAAALDPALQRFDPPRAFNCLCVPTSNCTDMCTKAYPMGGSGTTCERQAPQLREAECGCAFVYLQ